MPSRLVTASAFLLALSTIFWTIGTSGQVPAAVTKEAAGSKPTAAVEKLLNEASRLAESKQPGDALKVADQALDLARQSGDKPGEGFAQQARANALQDLSRTNEALVAWQSAAQIWAGLGDTPGQVTALVHAGLLCGPHSKRDAETFFAQGLSIANADTQHLDAVAQALHEAGIVLNNSDRKPEAFDYLTAALALREKQMPESLPFVELLNALANVSLGRAIDSNDEKYYSLSKDYSARAVEIGKRVAPHSSALVESLHTLCVNEMALDTWAKADDHCLDALSLQKKLVPDGSMTEASILVTLGRLGNRQTNFASAHQYFEEALTIGERLEPESDIYQRCLLFSSALESAEGNLQAARSHLLRLLAIQEKQQAWMAPTYINLGSVASDESDFESARQYLEKALDIYLKTKPNNVGVEYALANLGLVAYRQGDLESALAYYRRVIDIDSHRPDGTDTADSYDQIADVLWDQGNVVSAAEYYKRAMDVRSKIAPESLDVSYSLVNLAKVARRQRNLSLAIEYDKRALALGRKSCPNSWCVAFILDDIGKLAREQGDLSGSESYLREAVDVREQSLGSMHPDLASSLSNLALTLAAQGKTDQALADALRAEKIGAEHMRVSVRTLSERQALKYEATRASGLDLALTLAADRASTPSARSQVLDAVIRSRALVFDELATRHRSAYGSASPEVKQLADQLFSARARLATLVFRGAGDSTPDVYRNLLDDARHQKEIAELRLAEKSAKFRKDQANQQIGFKEISATLPPDAALVSFVHYASYDPQRDATAKSTAKPVPSYAAIVFRTGASAPTFVRLGSAHEVEGLVNDWRRGVTEEAEANGVNVSTLEQAYRHSGAALRRRIWDPLQPDLDHAKEVFVVPDGALHLVNFASLPTGSSLYLIEHGPLIHYLSTERDLIPVPTAQGEGLLVVGNPAFDHAPKMMVASSQEGVPTNTTTGRGAALLRGSRSACGTFQTLHFRPLPASQQEAEYIATLWKQNAVPGGGAMRGSASQSVGNELLQMTGADATREAFEQYAPGKRVLHLATHGFFLEGSCESATLQRLYAGSVDGNILPATAENPLLLSGLAFAGANRRASTHQDETDGILTAEEIAGLNLDGVAWAVLSACDTGVGEIKVGEGVFGLRRAFQVAGAKTVIMSLWPIEDKTAQQWMTLLYKAHFIDGKNTAESVRAASVGVLRQRRARYQSTNALYWGAFIASGDWH